MSEGVAATLVYTRPMGLNFTAARVSFSRWTNAVTSEYAPIDPTEGFARHFSKLREIQINPALWSEGAEAPSSAAIAWADLVLKQFRDDAVMPSRVVASAEGGVAICFVRGDKYADVECFNSGMILAVTSNRRDRPIVWEVEQSPSDIARTSARIREQLFSSSSGKNAPKG